MRRLRIGVAVLVAGLALTWLPAPAFAQGGGSPPDALTARMRAFLTAVNHSGPEGVLEFFPAEGDFAWVHTAHRSTGDHRGVWRFPARQAGEAIRKGPLWASFELQMESQPIGLFAHQVMMRGMKWHRVSPTRFVPPGETAASGIFVEWRREGSRWVVSRFGDEGYGVLPLPDWMDEGNRTQDRD